MKRNEEQMFSCRDSDLHMEYIWLSYRSIGVGLKKSRVVVSAALSCLGLVRLS